MATATHFEHPSLDWNAPDLYKEYTRFKDHTGFVFAGPLSELTPKQKAGWLGTWIGPQGREIYRTLQWTDGEKDDPDKVLAKFEAYVRPRKNKRIARHNLKQRKQMPSESFDQFLTELRLILMDCDYEDPEDILVDCIIDGVFDMKVQERLLDRGEELTLHKAVEICQQFEASRKQVRIVRGQEEDSTLASQIHKLRTEPRKSAKSVTKEYKPYKPLKSSTADPPRHTDCKRCGTDHSRTKGKCPAVGTTCSYCKKENHWARVCMKRIKNTRLLTDTVEEESSDDEDDVLAIYVHSQKTGPGLPDTDKWNQTLKVENHRLTFKIDTGAKCNTVTVDSFQQISHKVELAASKRILKTYSNHYIKPVGTATLNLTHKGITISEKFEIVNLKQENVISGETAEKLGLLARLSTIDSDKLTTEFPDINKTTGTLPGEYQIKLKPGVTGVIHAPRRQPLALKDRIIAKLKEMEQHEHITRVEQPTDWVSSMTVSLRGDKVRICLDPTDLNKAIQREHYPMKTIDEIAAEIPGTTVFSTLDAKNGFMQIKLDEASSLLTTFNTPIGRYRWLRLPFGVSCAPEVYQRIMDNMLEGISGAHAVIDDILIAGKSIQDHDRILRRVIERATKYNLQLNLEKTRLRQSQVTYVGHVITKDGLKPDPAKVTALLDMPAPSDKSGVKRFLGFVTYLGKFLPNLSTHSAPLRDLLKEDVTFVWQKPQEDAFKKLKTMCTECPVLALYDVKQDTHIQCDASSTGLGAVLLQNGKPIAFASRALTDTEKRYAQIEKEMLSILFACRRFHCYIFGKHTTVTNDHKPLEMIFRKPLHDVPMRLQRMMLSLQWYDLTVNYAKGSEMQLPDTLSRAYLPAEQSEIHLLNTDIRALVSISDSKYAELQQATEAELPELLTTILNGWPSNRSSVPRQAQAYWDSRAELTVVDGIILKGNRVTIPPSLKRHMISLIHESHLGMVKSKQRAREVLFWPGMSADIEEAIKNCPQCASFQNNQTKQPLKPTPHPALPFQEVSCDIFESSGDQYLITVDYYSKLIQVNKLADMRASTIIDTLLQIISVHGIPEIVRTDCGTQFLSQQFKAFCQNVGITHKPVSPHYQQANGLAERGVQTVKRLWNKGANKHLAVLDYNTTPLEGLELSPSQLLMGRRPRNKLPTTSQALQPKHIDTKTLHRHFKSEKNKQKFYHDRGAKVLSELTKGENVRIRPQPGTIRWWPAKIVRNEQPRSYVVEDKNGKIFKRNRKHIRQASAEANKQGYTYPEDQWEDISQDAAEPDLTIEPESQSPQRKEPQQLPQPRTTRSGRVIRAPERLDL